MLRGGAYGVLECAVAARESAAIESGLSESNAHE